MTEQVEKPLAVTADLVALVQEKLQQALTESPVDGKVPTVTKKEVKFYVSTLTESIVELLTTHKALRISGLGTFKVQERAQRAGHNPKTGEAITIMPSASVRLQPEKKVKQLMKETWV